MRIARVLAPASLLAVAWCVPPSAAYIAVPEEPIPNKVALADCVVVGKVVGVGKKPVRARLYPHQERKHDFVTAEVEVGEAIAGAEKGKTVKVGFLDFQFRSGQFRPPPEPGQEGCFFGTRVPDGEFFLVPAGGFHAAKAATFEKSVALARRCAKLLDEPDDGLKSGAAGDRLLTAYLLAMRDTYRPQRYGGSSVKAEPMEAGRSERIMLALAEADWAEDPWTGVSPGVALNWLRHPKSDWPATFPQLAPGDAKATAAAKAWLKENAATYRLRRLVPAGDEKR